MSSERLLRERLAYVEDRIGAACARARRERSEVTLVAVTKTVPAAIAGLLPGLGIFDLGESRPQALWTKAAELPATIRWHAIGHLQRNKLERTLPIVTRIHSVDSVRLLEALENFTTPLEVFLEFNTSGEASKQGFSPRDLATLAEQIATLRHVRVDGLMTMAALQDPEECRPSFQMLRDLRDQLRAKTAHPLRHLSMGMSNDFEVAIEEGATFIRVGSVLFEGLE